MPVACQRPALHLAACRRRTAAMHATPETRGGMSAPPAAAPPGGAPAQARAGANFSAAAATGSDPPRVALRTCRRCKQQFDPTQNGPHSCRYHSALYTGGEVSKAIGFCRSSSRPEDQLRMVVGRTGLMRFWDCCGAEDEGAPGCCTGRHVTYDDPDD